MIHWFINLFLTKNGDFSQKLCKIIDMDTSGTETRISWENLTHSKAADALALPNGWEGGLAGERASLTAFLR